MNSNITDGGKSYKLLLMNEEITIGRGSGVNIFPFQMMRKATVKNSRSKRVGAIATIAKLSKPAQHLLALIDESRALNDWIAILDAPVNRSETTMRSRAFKELEDAKLVKRARRHHTYMMSPDFLVPCGDDLESWLQYWNGLPPLSNALSMPYQVKKEFDDE